MLTALNDLQDSIEDKFQTCLLLALALVSSQLQKHTVENLDALKCQLTVAIGDVNEHKVAEEVPELLYAVNVSSGYDADPVEGEGLLLQGAFGTFP